MLAHARLVARLVALLVAPMVALLVAPMVALTAVANNFRDINLE
mgnify:FL=1